MIEIALEFTTSYVALAVLPTGGRSWNQLTAYPGQEPERKVWFCAKVTRQVILRVTSGNFLKQAFCILFYIIILL